MVKLRLTTIKMKNLKCQPTSNKRAWRILRTQTALGFSLLLLTSCSNFKIGTNDTIANSALNGESLNGSHLLDFLSKLEGTSYEQKKQDLNSFLGSNINAVDKEKCAYVLARLLKKTGTSDDLKQSIPLFEEAAQLPVLWERCQWHISEAAYSLGNEKLVRRSLSNIIEKTTDSQTKAQVEYSLAQSFLRASETTKAREQFESVCKEAPTSQYALGSRYYLGQMLLQTGDKATALKFWQDYLKESPDGRFAKEIVTTLSAQPEILSSADHAIFAEVYFAHGDWSSALKEWQIANNSAAWYKQAICLLRMGNKLAAKSLLLNGIKLHNKDTSIEDAGILLAKLSSKEEAISIWKLILYNCPLAADAALYNLALRSQGTQSLSYYAQIAAKYPKSNYAPESCWWLIWDNIKKGKSALALTQCKFAYSKYSKAKAGSRFSFWIGKLQEKLKQKEAAKIAYKNTIQLFGKHYYGWRAKSRLAALAGNHDKTWALNATQHFKIYDRMKAEGKHWSWPEPPKLVSFAEIESQAGPTIATLAELHQWDECFDLTPNTMLPELRALCLAKLNLPLEAINTVSKDLTGTPGNQGKWQLAYPLLFANIISSEARTKKVDPFLAQALIREESRYNTYALSSSNAIGLMQLLPGTAAGVAKRLNLALDSKQDIHKPENNIKLGVDYLGYTLNRFKGNAMLAVASYNGGPNAVQSWTKKYSLGDPDAFVENIPFSETREYVRKVFGSYWNYEAIYKL